MGGRPARLGGLAVRQGYTKIVFLDVCCKLGKYRDEKANINTQRWL